MLAKAWTIGEGQKDGMRRKQVETPGGVTEGIPPKDKPPTKAKAKTKVPRRVKRGKGPDARVEDPYKFTEEIGKQIVDYMSSGCSVTYSAQAIGIGRETLTNWLKMAADDVKHQRNTKLAAWKIARDQRQAIVRIKLTQDLARQSRDGNVQSTIKLWQLMDSFDRGECGNIVDLEVTGKAGEPLAAPVDLATLTTEKLTQRLEDLLALAKKRQGLTEGNEVAGREGEE